MFGAIGGALGSMLGGPLGGALGTAGGTFLGSMFSGENDPQEENRKAQKEFAQHGIRWKVADARAAGIHPLYALGAQTHSFTPTVAFGGDQSGMGAAMANAGQDITRAIRARETQSERAFNATSQQLQLQRMGLENQLLAAQIARVGREQLPPPTPQAFGMSNYLVEGQGDAPSARGLVRDNPMERVHPSPSNPSVEPGAIADVGYARTPSGYAPVMSEDAKERLEEDLVGTVLWNVRNRLHPTLGGNYQPPPEVELPEDAEGWFYHPFSQEYRPYRSWRDYAPDWLNY